MTKNKISLTLTILFFIGLPMGGMIFFWKDMHSRIQREAKPKVTALAQEVMKDWKVSNDEVGPEYELAKHEPEMEAWRSKFGALKSLGEARNGKSWARELKDQGWQFARFEYDAQFEKGDAVVQVTGTRLYLEPVWKLVEIKITPKS